jgi:uncharacterized protein
MSVIKRLHRLTGESSPGTEKPARSETIATLRKRIDKIMARRPESRPSVATPAERRSFSLKDVITGEDCHNAAGACFIQETPVDASAWHGHRRIGDFGVLNMRAAAFLANNTALAECRLEEGLFLDTETTGLAGGTGTMAFLIGLGWFDQGRFIVRQIFARDFTEEKAALSHLAEIAGAKRFLVSFNGKTFDVGLLSTRYIMNRLQNPFASLPHLDLLYPSRRLIAHRLENCRLATLEEMILGFVRRDDVPGSEIPQRYFDWLRGGDARPLRDIFIHNRLDIISLAALMDHLTELTHGSRDGSHTNTRDLLALARWYGERQDTGQSQSLLESLALSTDNTVRREARKMLSLIYRRAGRWEDAVGLWEHMLGDHPGDLFALIELAKWYEHRAHDAETALNFVRRALRQAGGQIAAVERKALLHRLQRLEQRQAEQPKRND